MDFLRSGDFLWGVRGQTELPTSGQHMLKAVADGSDTLIEVDETNNAYEQAYIATRSRRRRALPDLTVSAIKVNGHAPDGEDDCREGNNDVTVVVKNGAATNAGDFYVRLAVDDGKAAEKYLVDGLGAGTEQDIKFGSANRSSVIGRVLAADVKLARTPSWPRAPRSTALGCESWPMRSATTPP